MKYKQYKRFLFYLVEDELRDLSIHFYESYSSENSENLWESAATESEDLFDTEVLPFSLTASTTNAMTASAISENNWNNIEAQLVGRLSSEDPVDPLLSFPDRLEMAPELIRGGGYDVQGFYWDPLLVTREEYRKERNQSMRNYQKTVQPASQSCPSLQHKARKVKVVKEPYYNFTFSSRRVPFHIYHFQLRHLISHLTDVEVCYSNIFKVSIWNKTLRQNKELLNFQLLDHDIPMKTMKICCLTCLDESNIVLGGSSSEVVIYQPQEIDYSTNFTDHSSAKVSPRGFTNSIESLTENLYYLSLSDDRKNIVNHLCPLPRSKKVAISCNDTHMKLLDISTFSISTLFSFPWSVNCVSFLSDERVFCAVGDHPHGQLWDIRSKMPFASLTGHLDDCFSVAINSDTYQVATGSQDLTVRIYDLRKYQKTLYLLPPSELGGPVRNLTYSPDGNYLAAVEADDYVSIVEVKESDYQFKQSIDVFGELNGITFSRDSSSLCFGASSIDTGGLLEYTKNSKAVSWVYDSAFM